MIFFLYGCVCVCACVCVHVRLLICVSARARACVYVCACVYDCQHQFFTRPVCQNNGQNEYSYHSLLIRLIHITLLFSYIYLSTPEVIHMFDYTFLYCLYCHLSIKENCSNCSQNDLHLCSLTSELPRYTVTEGHTQNTNMKLNFQIYSTYYPKKNCILLNVIKKHHFMETCSGKRLLVNNVHF